LGSEARRWSAIQRAFATKKVVATAPIRLVQERGEQSGMLLFSAVTGGGNGQGVVVVALRIGTLMEALLRPASNAINAELIDLDQDQPLFDSLTGGAPSALFQQSFAFATKRFELRAAPSPIYLAEHRSWQSIAVLMAGVLSTSLLGALLLLGT